MADTKTFPVESDPFALAAKELSQGGEAAPAAPESPETPVAPEGVEASAPAESGATPATEADVVDGTDKVTQALKDAVAADPALGFNPEIRSRLGLPPLETVAPVRSAKDPIIVPKGQSDEEFVASVTKQYDDRMKEGKDFEAIHAVARAEAQRAGREAAKAAVSYVMAAAHDGALVDLYMEKHPEYHGAKKDVYARVQALRAKADVDALDDETVISMLSPARPKTDPKDAAKAASVALAAAAKSKTSAAASAAGSPANQRPAGVPGTAKPVTALDKAITGVFGGEKSRPASSFLYPESALKR